MMPAGLILIAAFSHASGQGAALQAPLTGQPAKRHETVPKPSVATPGTDAGRRILSTAYVRVGPDDVLIVERHGAPPLSLRGVTLGPRRYCGERMMGVAAGRRFCGDYAAVVGARPGPGPAPLSPVDVVGDGPARPIER